MFIDKTNPSIQLVATLRLNFRWLINNNYPETDSLYIDLSSKPSKESVEISEGIVLDYDDDGHITGIDIDNASHKIDLIEGWS